MKAIPASTLRNTDATERIKSSPAGERKTEKHQLDSVYQKRSLLVQRKSKPVKDESRPLPSPKDRIATRFRSNR